MTFLVVLRCGLAWCQRVIKARTRLWAMLCWRSSGLTRLNRRRQATLSGRSRPRFTRESLHQVRCSRISRLASDVVILCPGGIFSSRANLRFFFSYALALNAANNTASCLLLGSRITFHAFYFDTCVEKDTSKKIHTFFFMIMPDLRFDSASNIDAIFPSH